MDHTASFIETPLADPDAVDIDSTAIVPRRKLEDCNHLLGDHAALMRHHDERGYIFLRNVLDPDAVAEARAAMFGVMAEWGLIEPGAQEPVWTGKTFDSGREESPAFSGIARKLVENPANARVMAQILGQPASIIPIVQYRTYPPGGSITGIHQDGFFSPGATDFKPVWMPIADCPREVGGLMVAVDQCHRGLFHNVAKTPPNIPAGVIPHDAWATTDYFPGDVLILNPLAPHGSMPNVSDRCRVTIDTRVQPARNPTMVLADVAAVRADAIDVTLTDGTPRTFAVDEDTFIRIESPGVRQSIDDYLARTEIGRRIVVIFDGDKARTLRRASEN